jgi:hypothetical protein
MTRLTAVEPSDQDFLCEIQEQATALTRAFISFCQTAYVAKATSTRSQTRETNQSLGWTSTTATPYAKVGEWLGNVDPINLELLDIKTIMALCCEKYLPIIERLKDDRLTVAEVREEMTNINKALQKPKEPPKVLEWKQTKRGVSGAGQNARRFCVIRLEDPEAGAEFEAQFKQSEQPLPLFIRGLLRRDEQPADVWQQAQNEVSVYINTQGDAADEIAELMRRISECDRIIAQYANSINPSERMVKRITIEEKSKHQYRLEQLGAMYQAA